MNKLAYLIFAFVCFSCSQNSGSEKHQDSRENSVNVHERIKELPLENILIGSDARLTAISNYLIIIDHKSHDKLIHLFDMKTFKHITSLAYLGQGPGEIANIGTIEANEADRIFYVSDHGKQCIFSYPLDSVLTNPEYIPEVKIRMNTKNFPSDYQYINDTLSYAEIIEPTGNYGFNQSLAKWNMTTGEMKPMKYTHPEIEKKRISFSVSQEKGIYVECYSYHDLMTICTLDGELKYNIYGPRWDNKKSNKTSYFGAVAFCKDKIIVLYSGQDTFTKDKQTIFPTQLMVFDIDGNYIQTLETGYQIADFYYDEGNNRIIMSLDDVIQFAYLDMNGIIG